MSSIFLMPSNYSEKIAYAGVMPSRVPFGNLVKALIASGLDFKQIQEFLKKNSTGR